MACPDYQKIIQDFTYYYGIPLENLTFDFEYRIPVAQIKEKKETIRGLRNIVSLAPITSNPEKDVIQDQWVEYVGSHLHVLDDPTTKATILKELNTYLLDKAYFVGNELGPVDVLIYYFLYSPMLNLSFQEKEKYLNVSRWFNTVQRNSKTRQSRLIIPFSRISLYV